jgi:hypothetical protein
MTVVTYRDGVLSADSLATAGHVITSPKTRHCSSFCC